MMNQTIPQIHEELMRFGLHDLTRLEYGRLMWRRPQNRERLLRHWSDPRHPYSERFQTYRDDVEKVLTSDPAQDDRLNQDLAKKGSSLRAVIREIPPVFGLFYKDSAVA